MPLLGVVVAHDLGLVDGVHHNRLLGSSQCSVDSNGASTERALARALLELDLGEGRIGCRKSGLDADGINGQRVVGVALGNSEALHDGGGASLV